MGDLNVGTISGRVELEDAFSTVLDKVQAKLEPFVAGTKEFGDSIKEFVEDPLKFAKDTALEYIETLGPLGAGLAGIAVVAGAAGYGMYELAENTAQAEEAQLNFSRVTGAAIEEVGQLSAIAQVGGSSLDSLQSMLFQVERRMQATGEGATRFNNALADLKINADEFRNASPEKKIEELSVAMHAAQGSTTLMSDALAVMGRGALTNMPLLMKNFEELKEKSKDVALTLTNEDTAAAEDFSETMKVLGAQVSKDAVELGAVFMPVVKDTAIALGGMLTVLEQVVTVGGAVTGVWHEITDAMGNAALREQTALAVQDTFNHLVAEAEKEGKNYGEAIADAAEKMLKMGYSTQAVATATNMTKESIASMRAEMDRTAKAAITQGEAWDRVNEAFSGFTDISPQIRGLAKDMFDAKVSIDDIATTTNLSKEQVKSLTEQFKEAAKAEKDYASGWDNLNSLGKTYADVLAGVNPKTAQLIQYYVSLGAKVEDLVKAFPELTKTQIEAIDATVKANAKAADTIEGLYEKYYQSKWSLGATDLEKITINAEIEYETRVKQLQDQGVTDVEYYNALWDLRQKTISDNEDAMNREMAKRAEVSSQNDSATKGDVVIVETLAMAWDKVGEGLDATKIKVRALSGELETLEEAQKRFDMGSSFTYDLSSREGIAQYKKMNPAASFAWSDEQIMAYIAKGGNLAGLIATGVINPYAHMGGFLFGGPVVGDQIAQVHDGEYVVPKDGALVRGAGGGSAPGNSGGIPAHQIIINNPRFTDPQSMQKNVRDLGRAHIDLLRSQGWRPGPVKR